MNKWMLPMYTAPMFKPNLKSDAYRDGYRTYQSWECNGGDRPENPYWTGDLDSENFEYNEWQRGWDDAAWDS